MERLKVPNSGYDIPTYYVFNILNILKKFYSF